MGLHTTYVGHVTIEPALSAQEVDVVRGVNRTRHWHHPEGALRIAAHPADDEPVEGDVATSNRPARGAPGLWCPWTACERGHCLHWDGAEKPYQGEGWLRWLIDVLLRPNAHVADTSWARERGLTCDHRLDGMLVGERQETVELFALEVAGNDVTRRLLLPGETDADEWGYRGERVERADRRARSAARRQRYESALAADRAALGVAAVHLDV
jgi:hypothetical protein